MRGQREPEDLVCKRSNNGLMLVLNMPTWSEGQLSVLKSWATKAPAGAQPSAEVSKSERSAWWAVEERPHLRGAWATLPAQPRVETAVAALAKQRRLLPELRTAAAAAGKAGTPRLLLSLSAREFEAAVFNRTVEAAQAVSYPRQALSGLKRYCDKAGHNMLDVRLIAVVGFLADYVHIQGNKSSTLPKLLHGLYRAALIFPHSLVLNLAAKDKCFLDTHVETLRRDAPARTDRVRQLSERELRAIYDVCHAANEGPMGLYVWAFVILAVSIFARGEEMYDLQFKDIEFTGLAVCVDVVLNKNHMNTSDPVYRAGLCLHTAQLQVPPDLLYLCSACAVRNMLAEVSHWDASWRHDPVRSSWPLFGHLERTAAGRWQMTKDRARDLPGLLWPYMRRAGVEGTLRANFGRKAGPNHYRITMRIPKDACLENGTWAAAGDDTMTRVYMHESARTVAEVMLGHFLDTIDKRKLARSIVTSS